MWGTRLIGVLIVSVAVMLGASPASAKLVAGDVKAGIRVTSEVPIDDDFGGASLIGRGYTHCPAGTKVFTGGTYIYRTSLPSQPTRSLSAHVTNSTPTSDGIGWYSDAVNRGNDELSLRTVLRCLPEGSLADVAWRSKTIALGDDVGQIGGARTARCPTGFRAITGGSYFSTVGGAPEPNSPASKIMNSTPTADAEGWFGSAVAFGDFDFTVTVRCMPDEQLAGYVQETTRTAVPSGGTASEEGECPATHPAVGPAGSFLVRPGSGRVAPLSLGEGDSISPGGALESVRSFFASAVLYSDIDDITLVGRAFCLRK